MKKRLMAFLLAAVMLVGLLPLTALADEAETRTIKFAVRNGYYSLEDGKHAVSQYRFVKDGKLEAKDIPVASPNAGFENGHWEGEAPEVGKEYPHQKTFVYAFDEQIEVPQETFTVTYTDGCDGEAFKDQVYPNRMPDSRTPGFKGTPTRDGYTFAGWTPEKAEYVTKDVVYTATWTKDEQETYSVTYTDGCDGAAFNDQVFANMMPGSRTPGFKGTPARDGYTFAGWTPEKAQYVTEDVVYTATWTENEQETFTVTYTDGCEGAAFNDQVFANMMPGSRTPGFKGTPARDGYTFAGWTPEKAEYVTKDVVYTATWTENGQETFSVTYTDGCEGAAFDDQVFANMMPGSRTPGFKGTPARDGYTFAGWTPEKAEYVTKDVVYTATWTENGQETFSVTYTDGCEGAAFDDQVFANMMPGSRTPGFKGTPARDGYTFAGWTPEKAEYVTKDVVYTATWTENGQETFSVTYTDGCEGAAFDDQVFANMMPGSRTPGFKGTPARDGYTFAGWTPEKAEYVTKDVVYTATWTENGQETFSVTYTDGCEGAAFDDQVFANMMPGSRTPGFKGTPSREGYIFMGWSPEKAQYVTENAVYTAVWVEKEQETFSVTYTDGCQTAAFDDQVYPNMMPGARTPGYKGTPTREGYVFLGWTPTVAKYVNADVVYTAVWAEKEQETFSVTYTDGCQTAAFDDQVYPNMMPGARTPGYKGTPTREGYVFLGWTPAVAKYVNADVVYTAVWAEKEQETFSVTYTDGCQTAAFDDQVYPNMMPGARTPGYKGTPAREGYVFLGWTPAVAKYVTEDVVYTAVWAEKEQETFTVTYTDGVEDEEIFPDQTYIKMPGSRTPGYNGKFEREGYVFKGWTPEKATYVTEDVVYTAVWEKIEEETVTIKYKDGYHGWFFKTETYEVKAGEKTPAFQGNARRDGYTFKGWSPKVSKYATADVVYVAQWSKNTGDNPKTGDTIMMWVGILAVAAAGLAGAAYVTTKKKRG